MAVVDINEGNLEVARQMGADIGILSGRSESPIAVGERVKCVLGPDGPGVVIRLRRFRGHHAGVRWVHGWDPQNGCI